MFKTIVAFFAASFFLTSSVLADPPTPVIKGLPTPEQIKTITEMPKAPETKAAPTAPDNGDRYIIKEDPGGSVSEFIEALLTAKKNNMKFKIDGYCASACTLILATPLKLDVCVTPKASFKFHQPYAASMWGPYFSIPYVVQSQQMWDNLFMRNFPKWVQDKINANGGVPNVYKGAKPSDTFDIKYSDMKDFMPTCTKA